MSEGKTLEFSGVTKRFDGVAAVNDVSARIEPGYVTAFLGPNGAGKTTTLRILLGQLRADAGTATVDGKPVSKLSHPRQNIGWVAEKPTFRPRRTAAKHLTSIARQAGVAGDRVTAVLDLVGLSEVADMRISTYSLGMLQRLAVAEAMLGDPGALVLDEPANGLDPEGIRWMRLLIRRLADEGRTVLVSSHLLGEVQQIADRLLVLSEGKLVFSGGTEDLEAAFPRTVVVDATDRASLSRALKDDGYEVQAMRSGIHVKGAETAQVGAVAAAAGITLTSLTQRAPSLEEVFLRLVNGDWKPDAAEDAPLTDEELEASSGSSGVNDATPGDEPGASSESAPNAGLAIATGAVATTGIGIFSPLRGDEQQGGKQQGEESGPTGVDDADLVAEAEQVDPAAADEHGTSAEDAAIGDDEEQALPRVHRSTWQDPAEADDAPAYVSPLDSDERPVFSDAQATDEAFADSADAPDPKVDETDDSTESVDQLEVADDTVVLDAEDAAELDAASDDSGDDERVEHVTDSADDTEGTRAELPGSARLAGFLAGEQQHVGGAGGLLEAESNDAAHEHSERLLADADEARATAEFEASDEQSDEVHAQDDAAPVSESADDDVASATDDAFDPEDEAAPASDAQAHEDDEGTDEASEHVSDVPALEDADIEQAGDDIDTTGPSFDELLAGTRDAGEDAYTDVIAVPMAADETDASDDDPLAVLSPLVDDSTEAQGEER